MHFWSPEVVQRYFYLANENGATVTDGFFKYELCGKVHYRNHGDCQSLNNKNKSRVRYVDHEMQHSLCVHTMQNDCMKFVQKLPYETDSNKFTTSSNHPRLPRE